MSDQPAQTKTLLYSPFGGEKYVFNQPKCVEAFRRSFHSSAWSFNPWTGAQRHALDIQDDPQGFGIADGCEKMTTIAENKIAHEHTEFKNEVHYSPEEDAQSDSQAKKRSLATEITVGLLENRVVALSDKHDALCRNLGDLHKKHVQHEKDYHAVLDWTESLGKSFAKLSLEVERLTREATADKKPDPNCGTHDLLVVQQHARIAELERQLEDSEGYRMKFIKLGVDNEELKKDLDETKKDCEELGKANSQRRAANAELELAVNHAIGWFMKEGVGYSAQAPTSQNLNAMVDECVRYNYELVK